MGYAGGCGKNLRYCIIGLVRARWWQPLRRICDNSWMDEILIKMHSKPALVSQDCACIWYGGNCFWLAQGICTLATHIQLQVLLLPKLPCPIHVQLSHLDFLLSRILSVIPPTIVMCFEMLLWPLLSLFPRPTSNAPNHFTNCGQRGPRASLGAMAVVRLHACQTCWTR